MHACSISLFVSELMCPCSCHASCVSILSNSFTHLGLRSYLQIVWLYHWWLKTSPIDPRTHTFPSLWQMQSHHRIIFALVLLMSICLFFCYHLHIWVQNSLETIVAIRTTSCDRLYLAILPIELHIVHDTSELLLKIFLQIFCTSLKESKVPS